MRQIDIETQDESEIAIQMKLNKFFFLVVVVCRCHCCVFKLQQHTTSMSCIGMAILVNGVRWNAIEHMVTDSAKLVAGNVSAVAMRNNNHNNNK